MRFEKEAYELRMELVHNHTFDQANIKKADSLYRESEKRNSINGKLYALQIKYYAVANSNNDSLFNTTIDEYIALAQQMDYFEEYFDATNTKIQYEMGTGEYSRCMFMAHDMLKMAEKAHNDVGLYESNLLMGQIFKYRRSYNSALRYFNTALKHIESNDSIPHFHIYREIAECYGGNMQFDKALQYADLAKSWSNYEIYRIYAEFTYLMLLFQAQKREELHRELATTMLNQTEQYETMPVDMQITFDAMRYVDQGKYEAARKRLLDHNTEYRQLDILVLISQYQGDINQAFRYLSRLEIVRDSIDSELLDSELSELDVRLGKADAEYKAEQERRQHQFILALMIGTLLSVLIIGLYSWNRKSRTQNRQLQAAQQATEQKNRELLIAQQATNKALQEAENANAMRMHFIQNMTHEIRTPLNAIFGFTQLLTDQSIELDQDSEKEMCSLINDNTMKLTNMVDDIITLSNYDSHTVKLTKAPTDTASIIQAAMQNVNQPLPEGVQLNVQLDPSYPINTDADKLANALSQIISNAYKFTQSGSISIRVNREQDSSLITFIVEDTGTGIHIANPDQVFDRFFKEDEYIPGTGLGLSLCRAIITTLGGEVNVDTTYTEGARFVVKIGE